MNCTTINLDNAGIENYGKVDWHGRDDSPPPASINPPCLIVLRYHHTPEYEFRLHIQKRINWLESHGYQIIGEPRYIPYPNDGLNWKRGDISMAIIYYTKTD